MNYKVIKEAIFKSRPNRFIANVLIDNKMEVVHVKNTGRCKEILIEGTKVIVEESANPDRKTKYSLVAAYKGGILINIDSQVPNIVVYEGIQHCKIDQIKDVDYLKREVRYGSSRFDLYFEKDNRKGFIEVKGATLEKDGVVMFPDAPTERGTKHLNEMMKAVKEGYEGYIFFLIQMKGIRYFTPNFATDKDFSDTLKLAKNHGVRILAYDSIVKEHEIVIDEEVQIVL